MKCPVSENLSGVNVLKTERLVLCLWIYLMCFIHLITIYNLPNFYSIFSLIKFSTLYKKRIFATLLIIIRDIQFERS